MGILRYLCRERDVPDHWYPKDSKQQAKVDEYLEWQHLDTRLNCGAFFQQKVKFCEIFAISAIIVTYLLMPNITSNNSMKSATLRPRFIHSNF